MMYWTAPPLGQAMAASTVTTPIPLLFWIIVYLPLLVLLCLIARAVSRELAKRLPEVDRIRRKFPHWDEAREILKGKMPRPLPTFLPFNAPPRGTKK
jgi:hypothetical protein